MSSYLEACRERVVIYDGAFGTYVQQSSPSAIQVSNSTGARITLLMICLSSWQISGWFWRTRW